MQYDASTAINVCAYSAGVAVLDDQNRLLMVQESQPKAKGLWHIPACRVETGESFEDAALREAYEETGLILNLGRLLNSYVGTFPDGDHMVRLVWLATIKGEQTPQPIFNDEIIDCKFIHKKDFDSLFEQGKIRMYHTKIIFEDALNASLKAI